MNEVGEQDDVSDRPESIFKKAFERKSRPSEIIKYESIHMWVVESKQRHLEVQVRTQIRPHFDMSWVRADSKRCLK